MDWKTIDLTAEDMDDVHKKRKAADGYVSQEKQQDYEYPYREKQQDCEYPYREKQQDCEFPQSMRKSEWRKNVETGGHSEAEGPLTGSPFLVAQDDAVREQQKELLYEVLGPVFFGEKQAGSAAELEQLFDVRYGIDVRNDFYEGDEHYEEYLEAQQAIAEGMSIYGGRIGFADGALAELAERIWERMEQKNGGRFRRINTMLEE